MNNRPDHPPEDQQDEEAVRSFHQRLLDGNEELIPSEYVERFVNGEHPVKVWREFRGLSADELAEKAAISISDLSQIESGERARSIETFEKIAVALAISVDDLT
ncbi:hypothetical protein ATY77_26620 [Rhizobium sp. R634]|uniref:helix-turn-helix domain-containing protein n=1 Tax=Rhizobium sp. R634 TaxID=1764274 RepID=UPI000B53052E|nr:helix-turn-helix transcriptional regulator [Rhizobium sp. R634]OWV79706.1 hypothetical protein ATY77_26620 [Rhizobium sp. R634]